MPWVLCLTDSVDRGKYARVCQEKAFCGAKLRSDSTGSLDRDRYAWVCQENARYGAMLRSDSTGSIVSNAEVCHEKGGLCGCREILNLHSKTCQCVIKGSLHPVTGPFFRHCEWETVQRSVCQYWISALLWACTWALECLSSQDVYRFIAIMKELWKLWDFQEASWTLFISCLFDLSTGLRALTFVVESWNG